MSLEETLKKIPDELTIDLEKDLSNGNSVTLILTEKRTIEKGKLAEYSQHVKLETRSSKSMDRIEETIKKARENGQYTKVTVSEFINTKIEEVENVIINKHKDIDAEAIKKLSENKKVIIQTTTKVNISPPLDEKSNNSNIPVKAKADKIKEINSVDDNSSPHEFKGEWGNDFDNPDNE